MDERQNRIFERVAPIALEHGSGDSKRVAPETHFVNDLGFDSLTSVEFVMAIEDAFGVRVPEELVPQLQTVGQVVDWLAEQEERRGEPGTQ